MLKQKKIFSCIRRIFLFVTVLLLASLTALAEDYTEVTLTKAGTLSDNIEAYWDITSLKVSGPINGDDLTLLNKMASDGFSLEPDQEISFIGKLVNLDLTDANIVSGGTFNPYFSYDVIEDNVLPNGAFSYCHLESIKLPKSLNTIKSNAFWGCYCLSKISLGYTLPTCSTDAFYGVSSNATLYCAPVLEAQCRATEPWSNFSSIISSVSLASGVHLNTHITSEDKYSVTNLKVVGEINSEDVELMADMAKNGTLSVLDLSEATAATAELIKEYAFNKCEKLTNIILPKGITSIGEFAFCGCSGLTSVIIPDDVASIGYGAFYECTNLTSATIPNTVTSIGDYAFIYCLKLTSATIPNKVTSIGTWAFYGCSSLTAITIPNGVESIGSYAFSGCTGLSAITIPNTVTSMGDNAFRNCTGLTSATIGNSVANIGDYTFCNCSGLTEVTIPNTVKSIGSSAFKDCLGLTTLTMGESVTSIGNSAFSGCKDLTTVSIPNSVTSIGESAFASCTVLKSATIGTGVTSIGESAFSACTSLTEIILQGTTLPVCGTSAFNNISSNTTLYCVPRLEASCRTTEPWSSFDSIYPLVTLANENHLSNYIADDNKYTVTNLKVVGEINSEDVELMADMAKNGTLSVLDLSEATAATADLIKANAFWECGKLTNISLPKGITSIGSYAFSGCSSLTSVTIPNTVTNIGWYVFSNCSSLTSINIPDGVAKIDSYTFSNCSSLTSFTIPNSLTDINYGAFSGCSSLASITIPSSVTSIGSGAFQNCTSLTEVILQGTILPTCSSYAFDGISSNATLYCKAALLKKCQETAPWKDFKNIIVKNFSVAISDAGIATGCFDDDLDFTNSDIRAYIVSAFSPTEGKVLMTRSTRIPAKTGFIVKGTAGTYEIPAKATDYKYANMLVGTLEETTVQGTDDSYTNYVLGQDGNGNAGFFLADNTVVPANKAYLHIPTSEISDDSSTAKTSLSLGFDDEDDTTGVTNINEQTEATNGNAAIYNLNGQRMQRLTKGLNIVNGKKIFIK